jgi:hypothetical protein
VSLGIEFPENISANFFLSVFEKSKSRLEASSSFKITNSGS